MSKLKRIPNYYAQIDVRPGQSTDGVVLDNHEFVRFLVGQQPGLPPEAAEKFKVLMQGQDRRLQLFLAAYVQKNTNRLARLMQALDVVDNEVVQPYRIKTMDTGDLLQLMTELNNEKSRTFKELAYVKESGTVAAAKEIVEEPDAIPLTIESRTKVMKFLKEKFTKNED